MRRWRSRGSLPTPATGRDPVLRQFCHDNQVSYVLAVPVDLPLLDVYGKPLRPDVVLADTPNTGWQRRSAGDGSKGKRFYDWAAHTVTVKDQPAAEGHEHTLLIRRARTPKVTTKHPDGTYEVEYFLVHARTGTRIPAMIGAAGLGKDHRPRSTHRCVDPEGPHPLQSRRDPWPARRRHPRPRRPRPHRRHHPRPMAARSPNPGADQPLPTPRRPATSRSPNVVQG